MNYYKFKEIKPKTVFKYNGIEYLKLDDTYGKRLVNNTKERFKGSQAIEVSEWIHWQERISYTMHTEIES